MIVRIQGPDSDDSLDGTVRLAGDVEAELREPEGMLTADMYAEAELLRRHERTELMIRKAHEQFL